MKKCTHEDFKSTGNYTKRGEYTQEQKDNLEDMGMLWKCLDCGARWTSEMSPEDALTEEEIENL